MVTRDEFDRAVQLWEEESGPWSFTDAMKGVPSFAIIVNMGEAVIPWILAYLQERRSFLFLALEAITGENPTQKDHRGRIDLMIQDWIEWGCSHGYIHPQLPKT